MTRRVLYVNHDPLGSASTYRQVGLAKYLTKKGFRCDFLGRSRLAFGASVEADGREWAAFRRRAYWREPLVRNLAANVELYREEAKNSDFVHVNRAYPYTAAILTAGASQGKLVVDMEDWDGFGGYSSYANLYDPKGLLLTISELVLPRRADLVLAVSRLIEALMRARGVDESKLLYLPNGVDQELFDRTLRGIESRNRLGIGGEPVVMYTSTFWSWESSLHKTALETFRAIASRVPDAKFLMTGPGELSFKRQIEALGLKQKVKFTGYVPREEMPRLMAAADIAIHVISDHPFHRASSPMVVPEYMAMGKAIVAPDIGELSSMLGGGAGVLVRRPQAAELAEAAVKLLNDEKLRLETGELAFRAASQRYSYTVLAGRLELALSRLGG